MSFTVNYAGKEKDFSSKDHAIKFQDGLNCGSDLWICNTLLRTRMEQSDGSYKITVYNYDGGDDIVYIEGDITSLIMATNQMDLL